MITETERRRSPSAIGPRTAVLDAIVRHTSRRLGGAAAFVGVVGSGRPYLRSEVGLPGPIWRSPELPLLDSLTLLVGGRAEPHVVTGVEEGEGDPPEPLERLGFSSMIGLPLRQPEGAVLGALCILADAPRRWSGHDLGLATDMATLATSEIEVGNSREVGAEDLDPAQVPEWIEEAFAAAPDHGEALGATLECLCAALSWDFGTAWAEDSGKLRKTAHWHRPSLAFESFAEVCEEMAFGPGEDAVGDCWVRGEARLRTALPEAGDFSRAAVAETAGLRCGAWIPLGGGDRAIGVIELLGTAEVPEHARKVPELAPIGELVGELLAADGPAGPRRLPGPFRGLPDSTAW